MIYSRYWLTILTLGAFAWRLHGITEESLWRDEVDAIFFALRDLPATLSMFVSAGQNGPLYFITLRPWFQLIGSSEFALRFPSAAAGTLCIPLIFHVCHKLLTLPSSPLVSNNNTPDCGAPRQDYPYQDAPVPDILDQQTPSSTAKLTTQAVKFASYGAAIFLATNPYQLWYSQEGKMYSIIVALTLLSSWLWLHGVQAAAIRAGYVDGATAKPRQPRYWATWIAYLLIMSLSIYTHLLMILLIPIHILWFWIAWPLARKAWSGYALALAGLTLPYLPMVWWQWDMLTATSKRTGYNFVPFNDMISTLLNNHSQGFMEPLGTPWLGPLTFLIVAGLLLGPWEVGWRRYLILLTWLVGPVLLIYGLSLRQPIFVDRYIIWISPAALIFLAIGLITVWKNASLLGGPLALCLVLYISGFWLYAGWDQKQLDIKYDLRSAVTTIEAERQSDELLILQIPHMEYSYRYYSSNRGSDPFALSTERLGQWAGGLWTNNGLPDEQARAEVANHMLALTGSVETVWVLRSEVEMWDQRHLMDEWLAQNGEQVAAWNYHGSQVHKYILEK